MAALYLASLYDSSRSKFDKLLINTVLPRAEELQYVLFFTVSRKKDLGLHLMKQVTTKGGTKINGNLVVDLAFECQYQEAATMVDEYSQTTTELQNINDRARPAFHPHGFWLFLLSQAHGEIFQIPAITFIMFVLHIHVTCVKHDSDMFDEYENY